VNKNNVKPSLVNLSVEEENLAAIPFAVLERRVGKRIGKIEIKGNKILPNGSEMEVVWQIQGNNELGLPTEQDLDIFVALGVLTFRNNFAKTVTFSGREIARMLNINSVHGKFYQRLKLAMDRFIPLRFRALTATDRQEEVKWSNVFQEASFLLDRETGRCTGSVTWTDKLIQSINNGFFRVLDAGRYMELDGITAKHLYRFFAVAFEKTDLIVIDARKLAMEHVGILKPPHYFSRLMQTLEPAFDQLIRIQVLGSYHVISAEEWRIALHRHPSYVPERKSLMLQGGASPELSRAHCQSMLEKAGFTYKAATAWCEAAQTPEQLYTLERAAQLVQAMKQEGVLPHVAASYVSRALDLGTAGEESREVLDWCEISLETCRHKKRTGQNLKNAAGLLVKIIKDPVTRRRLVDEQAEAAAKERYRQRERAVLRQNQEAEERAIILEYEQFRQDMAQSVFEQLSEAARQTLSKEKTELLRHEGRLERMAPEVRDREITDLILQDLARSEVPPYGKWLLRKRASQAVLPFSSVENIA
jgi:Replication initiator protein A